MKIAWTHSHKTKSLSSELIATYWPKQKELIATCPIDYSIGDDIINNIMSWAYAQKLIYHLLLKFSYANKNWFS